MVNARLLAVPTTDLDLLNTRFRPLEIWYSPGPAWCMGDASQQPLAEVAAGLNLPYNKNGSSKLGLPRCVSALQDPARLTQHGGPTPNNFQV